MITELIDKYIWLIRTVAAAGTAGISLRELSDRWEDRYGAPYPRRTFIHHREAVSEIFGIDITCNRGTRRYLIRYGQDAIDRDQAIDWLINTFTVNNLLPLGKERLSGRVSVEDIPSGQKHLTPILAAMEDNRELEIRYRRYDREETDVRIIRPYAVKEFEKRWYVIGYRPDEDRLRTYALDRIQGLSETGGRFKMPEGFDVDETFAHSFGIYLPEGEPAVVTLRAGEREARYLRDLPLHPSQQELPGGIFRYYVIPNDNFYMELCRHGDRIEVLEPAAVRARIADELRRASNLYQR